MEPIRQVQALGFTDFNRSAFSYYTRLGRVERFVAQHYDEPIPLARAARVAGYGEKYFSTLFHQKTGVRFRDWLSSVRVGRAMRLLEQRNHSITGIALDVGFQDLRTFQRTFKKLTGMTPWEFKKSVRPA